MRKNWKNNQNISKNTNIWTKKKRRSLRMSSEKYRNIRKKIQRIDILIENENDVWRKQSLKNEKNDLIKQRKELEK